MTLRFPSTVLALFGLILSTAPAPADANSRSDEAGGRKYRVNLDRPINAGDRFKLTGATTSTSTEPSPTSQAQKERTRLKLEAEYEVLEVKDGDPVN